MDRGPATPTAGCDLRCRCAGVRCGFDGHGGLGAVAALARAVAAAGGELLRRDRRSGVPEARRWPALPRRELAARALPWRSVAQLASVDLARTAMGSGRRWRVDRPHADRSRARGLDVYLGRRLEPRAIAQCRDATDRRGSGARSDDAVHRAARARRRRDRTAAPQRSRSGVLRARLLAQCVRNRRVAPGHTSRAQRGSRVAARARSTRRSRPRSASRGCAAHAPCLRHGMTDAAERTRDAALGLRLSITAHALATAGTLDALSTGFTLIAAAALALAAV